MDTCLKSTLNNYNFRSIDIDYTEFSNTQNSDNNSSSTKVITTLSKEDEYMSTNKNHKNQDEEEPVKNPKKYIPPHKSKSSQKNQSHNPSKNQYQKRNGFNNSTTKNEPSINMDISFMDEEKLAMRRKRFESNNNNTNVKTNINGSKLPITTTTPTTKRYDYGLISRGDDKRLQESQTEREEFFLYILNKFIQYTSQNTSRSLYETIEKLKELNPEDFESAKSLDLQELPKKDCNEIMLDSLSMDIRKLRESLLNQPPTQFHKKVFLFSVRFSNYFGNFKTYIPSINYLLHYSKQLQLTKLEIEEIIIVLVLHLVHKNNNLQQAMNYYVKYIPNRPDILHIIKAWVYNDYFTWISIYNNCENYTIKSMMSLGLNKIINKMIKIITSSYYNLHKSVIERNYLPKEMKFEEFKTKYNVTWELEDNGNVIIRRRNRRK
ncbi:hypothetical protein KGF54_001620 [Candida jiufengensis]|uniref:uncharacterized protein n=1 Tax=Candida jiufengensis TaxID=497108 RepID=UPI0022255F1F|nr:uncharacterized protein KGF54_001620 [Candida jiufengensis]KAI5955059.1 hypothetical protein KGF54_001620 [Candida jiufengensis]